MRIRKFAVCMLLCAGAAFRPVLAQAEPVPAGLQAEVTKFLQDRFKAPASEPVSFTRFRSTANGSVVCGAVGPRGAAQPFYFIKVNTTGVLTGTVVNNDAERDMASVVCNG